MSIYRVHKPFVPEGDVTAPIPREKVAAHIPPAPRTAESQAQWAHLRKSNPTNVVLPRSRKWIDELPSHVRPIHLIDQFPRIVNLLVDHRGGRRGFPGEVHRELVALRDHYFGTRSTAQAPLV